MIQVVLFQRQGQCCGFSMSGHADMEEAGKDIFCAGVSVLAYHTLNALEELTENTCTCEERDGYLSCMIQGLPNEEGVLLLSALELSLKQMQTIQTDNHDNFLQLLYQEG